MQLVVWKPNFAIFSLEVRLINLDQFIGKRRPPYEELSLLLIQRFPVAECVARRMLGCHLSPRKRTMWHFQESLRITRFNDVYQPRRLFIRLRSLDIHNADSLLSWIPAGKRDEHIYREDLLPTMRIVVKRVLGYMAQLPHARLINSVFANPIPIIVPIFQLDIEEAMIRTVETALQSLPLEQATALAAFYALDTGEWRDIKKAASLCGQTPSSCAAMVVEGLNALRRNVSVCEMLAAFL